MSMHGVGKSMHGMGMSVHGEGKSMHGVGKSMHEVGKSMHEVGKSMHEVGRRRRTVRYPDSLVPGSTRKDVRCTQKCTQTRMLIFACRNVRSQAFLSLDPTRRCSDRCPG